MALTVYATTADLADRLGMSDDDAAANTALVNAIESASRAIDGMCGGRFFGITASETRYFQADYSSTELEIDDLVSLTALVSDDDGDRTYETTWATTDYDLEPYNAAAKGMPYTSLQVTPAGRYTFSTQRKGVSITGLWGWPSVPAAIREATCVHAARLYKRKDAPFGVAGSNELGMVTMMPKFDPDVVALIAPYRRMTVGAI